VGTTHREVPNAGNLIFPLSMLETWSDLEKHSQTGLDLESPKSRAFPNLAHFWAHHPLGERRQVRAALSTVMMAAVLSSGLWAEGSWMTVSSMIASLHSSDLEVGSWYFGFLYCCSSQLRWFNLWDSKIRKISQIPKSRRCAETIL
jgi:hypothetical protein